MKYYLQGQGRRRFQQVKSIWFFRAPAGMINAGRYLFCFQGDMFIRREIISVLCLLVLFVGSHSCVRNAVGEESVRFKTHRYIDTQGIGLEAFRILIPADWHFNGGLKWRLDNPGIPVEAGFRVRNPRGAEEFEVFPNLPFFLTNNRMMHSMFPIGSRYFGNEVRPPVGAIDALSRIVLPRFRSNAEGLRIISRKSLPDLAGSLGQSAQAVPGMISISTDGAKIHIEHKSHGKYIEEEIYCVISFMTFNIQSMYGPVKNINWTVDPLFSFKAEKGKLKANTKLFQTIVRSFRINLQWFNKYNQLVNFLIQRQIQQIHTIGQISRIISQTHSEISDMIMQSYRERQAVNDRIADKFSQYIRGVDKYYNPINQKPVELPVGYGNAWTNGIGDYIVSDSPSFNPNIGSNQNWQRMPLQN